MSTLTKRQALIWASGFYLTEHLDDALLDGNESELDDFLTSNAWEPFEHNTPDDIYAHIDQLATSALERFS